MATPQSFGGIISIEREIVGIDENHPHIVLVVSVIILGFHPYTGVVVKKEKNTQFSVAVFGNKT